MRIYDFPTFPNPLRIRIALAEKGLANQVEFVLVDLPAAEHKQPPFLAINPEGTVPVLELDDGTYISECTAITVYLDHLQGESTLTGITPKDKAIIHMMQKRAERELLYAVGNYFHYGTPGAGPAVEAYKLPQWQGRTEWGALERKRAVDGMHYFDNVLSKQPYVAGEQFSMADITLWAGLYFAAFAEIAIPEECTSLKTWHAKVSERPSVKQPA
ncbi:glutathione S-transferase [Pseudomonas frederiksbergensis]|jgi:glutathione S-transferase|uniref:glutathione S-transferase family protein n=1 Tax=Pseudomonas frederiksbergensis TaxID=104087 RepID=UPI003D2435E1